MGTANEKKMLILRLLTNVNNTGKLDLPLEVWVLGVGCPSSHQRPLLTLRPWLVMYFSKLWFFIDQWKIATRARRSRGILWVPAAKTGKWHLQAGARQRMKCRDGARQSPSPERIPASLQVCVKPDACPSGWSSKTSKRAFPGNSLSIPQRAASLLGLGAGGSVSNEFQSSSSVFLWSCGSHGPEPPLVSKARCFGAHLSGAGLKSWCRSLWGPNPLHLKEKLLVLSSRLTVGCCSRDGVYSETVFQPLLPTRVWAFSHSPDE